MVIGLHLYRGLLQHLLVILSYSFSNLRHYCLWMKNEK